MIAVDVLMVWYDEAQGSGKVVKPGDWDGFRNSASPRGRSRPERLGLASATPQSGSPSRPLPPPNLSDIHDEASDHHEML